MEIEDPHKGQKIAVGDTAGASARGSEQQRQLKYELPPTDNNTPPLYAAVSTAIGELDAMLNMLGTDGEGNELHERCRHFRRYIIGVMNTPKTGAWMHRDPVLQLFAFMAKEIGEYTEDKAGELKKMADALYNSAESPTGALQSGTEDAVAYALYCDPEVDKHSEKLDGAAVAFLQWLKLVHEDSVLAIKCRYCDTIWEGGGSRVKSGGLLHRPLLLKIVDHFLVDGECQSMDDGRRAFIKDLAEGREKSLRDMSGEFMKRLRNFSEARTIMMRYVGSPDKESAKCEHRYMYDFHHAFTRDEMAYVDICVSACDRPFDSQSFSSSKLDYSDPEVRRALGYKPELIRTEDRRSILSDNEEVRKKAQAKNDEILQNIRTEFESFKQG